MSMKKMEASALRAEMARRRISRRELSEGLGLSYGYIKMILSGHRDAGARRAEIYAYITKKRHKENVA